MIKQMIRIPKDLLADFKWLAKAIAKDKTRPALMCFHVEDKDTIVTTDGRRLHMLTRANHCIPRGNYRIAAKIPLIIEADPETTYPNWRQVIPTDDNATVHSAGDRHIAASLFGQAGGVMDLDFITQAFNGGPMKMLVRGPLDPVILKDETRLAVIMPMRSPR
jgi:hypothetical protein